MIESIFKSFIEFVGTFIFLSVIIKYVKEKVQWAAFPIVLTLLAMIFWAGSLTGGHFNPAVTTMFYFDKSITPIRALLYIIAQLFGGFAALQFYNFSIPSMKK